VSDCQLPSKTFGKATVPLVGEQGPTKKLAWTPACMSELHKPRKKNSTAATYMCCLAVTYLHRYGRRHQVLLSGKLSITQVIRFFMVERTHPGSNSRLGTYAHIFLNLFEDL